MPEPIVIERPVELTNEAPANLGAQYDPQSNQVSFRVFSKNATLIRIYFYKDPIHAAEVLVKKLAKNGSVWEIHFPLDELRNAGITTNYIYYGYRAWGPNWEFSEAWLKGTDIGFHQDVDNNGARFNPNKLLIDPYAREISHDPQIAKLYMDPPNYWDEYYGGNFHNRDNGSIAPKSTLLLHEDHSDYGVKPNRALKDDVIYEVNLRGFTMMDDKIPPNERGTYKGAGKKAKYLKELGVTAVEFLPVHEFADNQNDDGDPRGDNYWGYMTINYFAPNLRYSSDKNPGNPTREFKEMVKAFHEEGIKVFLDVVYNHTGEGLLKRNIPDQGNPTSREEIENAKKSVLDSRGKDELQDPNAACYLSYSGLDNQSYYYLRNENHRYEGRGSCGGNLNYDQPVVQYLILDSLKYWKEEMGVDGFRFDLAPILSVSKSNSGYQAGNTKIFNQISEALPSRLKDSQTGADLIAEPWGDNSNIDWNDKFPKDWAVWNKEYRDHLKKSMNKYGYEKIPVSKITTIIAGSDIIRKKPWNSINYFVSHDDTNCLRNVFTYNSFWHLDESEEKPDQISWDQLGDPESQKKSIRNAFTLLMLAAGVPMFTGGDEIFRAIPPYKPGVGKMNLVSVDAPEVYLDFKQYNEMIDRQHAGDQNAANQLIESNDQLYTFAFVQNLINFRNKHQSLRRENYFTGEILSNGLADITWYKADGNQPSGTDWDQPDFIAWRINAQLENVQNPDDKAESIYVAYNINPGETQVQFPANVGGKRWYRVLDTDNTGGWMTKRHNFDGGQTLLENNKYTMHGRSMVVLVEK
ncbi:MAG TPA: alpha-amylase family glycosyl hydrolase [Bacillota bacterium]|nr:alpha-amylase family glycosyl hydrolase [Bacillota bacterium]